ncbi:transposable element Tcb2 transposase [Trichonephila clavipes]|nr:transposable element Tcb2 transposase [Trichonephila clavipes]
MGDFRMTKKELVCSGTDPQSDTSLEAMERRVPNNSKNLLSGRRKVASLRDVRHLLSMAVSDRTASSRQLLTRWSTATSVLIRQRLLLRVFRRRVPLYRILFSAIQPRLPLQSTHDHRAWQEVWLRLGISPVRHGRGTINIIRATTPLERYVDGEERYEAPDYLQGVLPIKSLLNRTESYCHLYGGQSCG